MAVSSAAVLSKSLLNIDDDDYDDVFGDNHDLNQNLIKSASFIFINDLVLTPPVLQQQQNANNQNLTINKVGSYVELRLKRLSETNSNTFYNQQQLSPNNSVSTSLYKTRSRSVSLSSTSRSSSSSSFSSLFNYNNNETKIRKKNKLKTKNKSKKKFKLSPQNNSQTLMSNLTSTGLTASKSMNKIKKKKSVKPLASNCKTKKSKFSKLNDDYLISKSCVVASSSLSNFSLSQSCNNNSLKSSKKLKCLLVGDARIGKSALMFFFLKRIFQSEYQPTIVDDYEVKIVQNGESYTLSLFDTAGQEDWETLRVMAYPDTDVIILCFSVVRPDSMENIKTKWMPELNKYLPDALIILVGTQVDLRDQSNNNNNNSQRHITTREGEELKQKISAFKYIECSALTQINIKEVFDSCIEAYAKSNPPIQPSCFETLFRQFTKTIRRRFSLHNQRSSTTNSSNSNSNSKNNAKLAKYSNSKESASRKYLHEQ